MAADERRRTKGERRTFNLESPWLHIALILLVAGFFRLWLIDRIPPGLFGDEATDGLDALDVLAGRGAVFFPANYGREGLHMWIVAGMFRLLGIVPLALRLPSAIAGILTALATYWLGRELFGTLGNWETGKLVNRKFPAQGTDTSAYQFTNLPVYQSTIPLLASLYVATSYWHIHFSRFGIRGVFTPLFGTLAFAAFWRAVNCAEEQRSREAEGRPFSSAPPHLRTSGIGWFVLSGASLGIATYFYTASRFFPIFLGGFLVLQTIIAYATRQRNEASLVRHFRGIVLLYALAALVFLPLGIYFAQHPGSFSQRASEVVATTATQPWARMAEAALANLLQFFVPGRGDPAQFYNLPQRAVFDLLTAALALVGIGVLLWRWKQPPALFLLTWFPALLLPSFLATDRFPTLPRVLGVIPGVYFFPAIGLLAVASLLVPRQRSGGAEGQRGFSSLLRSSAPLLICTLALLIHAGHTYRDYFRVWGPSQATFDAFEGDMVVAWQWLEADRPAGHVYLSSDIYRHPTFMLLGERATVQTYFQHQNPELSWFDARGALPLPPPDQPATYLIGNSAPLSGHATELLMGHADERDRVLAPDGSPALAVLELPAPPEAARFPDGALTPVAFTDRLALTGAAWNIAADGASELWLEWQTAGPDPAGWPGYRLEIASGDQISTMPFDSFRSPEWVVGGRFLTWHRVETSGNPPRDLRLRLLRAEDGQPLTLANAPEGWHAVTIPQVAP